MLAHRAPLDLRDYGAASGLSSRVPSARAWRNTQLSVLSRIRDSAASRNPSSPAWNARASYSVIVGCSLRDRYLSPSISLLTDFEDASSYLDWTVGTHGIHITFTQPASFAASSVSSSGSNTPSPRSSSYSLPSTRFNSKRPFTATYLPEVIPEQGWDKIEAVDSAIRKAGWNGQITEDLRRNVKLRRYQSRQCTVGWDEYVQWRKENSGEI